MKQKFFYHYTRFSNKIRKHGKLLAGSYPKTNTYDFVLDFCPEILLSKKEAEKLKKFKLKNRELINKYRNDWKNDKNYFSAYRNLKLKHKNQIINEFFKNKWYTLAFSELFEKGWIKNNTGKSEAQGSNIFNKIGNEYVKFEINKKQLNKSFVLEQYYWTDHYMKKIMIRKFGKNWWAKYLKYDKIFYKKLLELNKEGIRLMSYFAKNIFGKYYLSIERLKTYKKGSFKLPEYWIYGDIPISKCEFGEVNLKTFKEKTGFSKKDLEKRGIRRYDHTLRMVK